LEVASYVNVEQKDNAEFTQTREALAVVQSTHLVVAAL